MCGGDRDEKKMGNQTSVPGGLDCCTAVEGVGEDGDELNDGHSSVSGSQSAAHARSRRFTKPDRGVCRELTGESLFTECIDDRCGNRDSKGRRREGMPGGYSGTEPAPIARDGYAGGDGGNEPTWCVSYCQCQYLCV